MCCCPNRCLPETKARPVSCRESATAPTGGSRSSRRCCGTSWKRSAAPPASGTAMTPCERASPTPSFSWYARGVTMSDHCAVGSDADDFRSSLAVICRCILMSQDRRSLSAVRQMRSRRHTKRRKTHRYYQPWRAASRACSSQARPRQAVLADGGLCRMQQSGRRPSLPGPRPCTVRSVSWTTLCLGLVGQDLPPGGPWPVAFETLNVAGIVKTTVGEKPVLKKGWQTSCRGPHSSAVHCYHLGLRTSLSGDLPLPSLINGSSSWNGMTTISRHGPPHVGPPSSTWPHRAALQALHCCRMRLRLVFKPCDCIVRRCAVHVSPL